MEQYAGIDVSLESASICVVDANGKIVREGVVASEPKPLIAWLVRSGAQLCRVGLEAGPLSQWLYAGLKAAGLPSELIETRHVRDAFRTMAVKTDRKDAQGIAQLMRLGWFKPVHCKSASAQEVRAILAARRLLQSKLYDMEMSLRGILRGFGLKVGKTTSRIFPARIRELVTGHEVLETVAEALLSAHAVLARQFTELDRCVRRMARNDGRARLLMTTPGVGAIVAMTYVSAIDQASRLRSSKSAGALFGLTPRRYQSGEIDITGRISKTGDQQVRTVLYEAAHVILTRPVRAFHLKSWAMRVAKRTGMRKAKVALARRLAVILHRMLADGTPFHPQRAAAPRAA